jgi:hypothetical protein
LRTPDRRDFGLCLTELLEQGERQARLTLVDPAHGKTDVHEDPIANATRNWMGRVDYTREVHFTFHATDIDHTELVAGV